MDEAGVWRVLANGRRAPITRDGMIAAVCHYPGVSRDVAGHDAVNRRRRGAGVVTDGRSGIKANGRLAVC